MTFTSGNRIGKNEKNEDKNRRCCGMRMKMILSIVLAMVLLASAVPLAVTPAAAVSDVYEEKIAGDADENNELTKEELVNAILPYMLDEGELELDDVGDAAYIYAYWGGKPMTVTDTEYREVTFYRPVERVVTDRTSVVREIVALGECDKIVGVSHSVKTVLCYGSQEVSPICAANVCGGRLYEIPEVGQIRVTNLELAVSLKPDVIFSRDRTSEANILQERTGVPTLCANLHHAMGGKDMMNQLYRHINIIGKTIGKEQEAEELNSFFEEITDKVRDVTSEIPEVEKPRVYLASRGSGTRIARTTPNYAPLDIAGGINVAKDVPGNTSTEVTISKEQIIKWNPDIIVVSSTFSEDDPLEVLLASHPELQTINAVKNESVYYFISPYSHGIPQDRNLVNAFYLAKLFYPDKFEDLDVEEEGNEIFKAFLGVDGLFTEFADNTIWMREYLDSQK